MSESIEFGPKIDAGFIRLFFRDVDQEEIAYRWASRLAALIGPKATDLRPDTTFAEILEWAARSGTNSMDFVLVFEPELGTRFRAVLKQAEHWTFREMVEECWYHSR